MVTAGRGEARSGNGLLPGASQILLELAGHLCPVRDKSRALLGTGIRKRNPAAACGSRTRKENCLEFPGRVRPSPAGTAGGLDSGGGWSQHAAERAGLEVGRPRNQAAVSLPTKPKICARRRRGGSRRGGIPSAPEAAMLTAASRGGPPRAAAPRPGRGGGQVLLFTADEGQKEPRGHRAARSRVWKAGSWAPCSNREAWHPPRCEAKAEKQWSGWDVQFPLTRWVLGGRRSMRPGV